MKIVMSSGHGKHIDGAIGPSPWGLDEHAEAVRVVNRTAEFMRQGGVDVVTYEDTVSDDQDENLKRIVSFHNAQGPHDLDVSIHFNSADFNGSNQTSKPVGTEVYYESSSGKTYAKKAVDAIASASGLINRGPKDGNLYFLSNTEEVAVLVEVCFVNSKADVNIYHEKFDEICKAIASSLGGSVSPPEPVPPDEGVLLHVKGNCSWFGGPEDTGVDEDEGLAFFYELDDARHLFLPTQPPGTTGLARRLDPETFYVACRWDYDKTPKSMLRDPIRRALVRVGNREIMAYPGDWGPHEDTGRVADLSPGAMRALDLETDDVVEIIYPAPVEYDE
jgi:hypothetical protein